LGWDPYFVAYNLQRILSEVNRFFYWNSRIPNFRENYSQVEVFFTCKGIQLDKKLREVNWENMKKRKRLDK
jgi:hypothetical protein